ncbi:MAG: MFS transporter [Myxococcota bacterium]
MIARPGRHRIALVVIFSTILIDFIGFSILLPVLPSFVRELGAESYHVPLITALYALALVLFLPLWGWISDRIGRRPVLLVSLLGTALSFVLLASSESLRSVYIARFLGGFFGASIGTAQAYMTDLTDADSRAEGMGLLGAAAGIGLVLGAALGGALAYVNPTLPFWVTAAVAGLNFALATCTLPESRTPEPATVGWRGFARVLIPTPILVAASVHNNQTRLYLYLFLHIFFAFSAIEAMFPLFAQDRFGWNELQIGLFMALVGVVLGSTQGFMLLPLVRAWGEAATTAVGLAVMGASTVALSMSFAFPWLVFFGIGLAVGAGLALPTLTSLFSKVCGEHAAGEYLSQSQAMVHSGRALGAFCWGWVFYAAGTGAPFLFSGLGTLGALLIFVLGARVLLPEGLIPPGNRVSSAARTRGGPLRNSVRGHERPGARATGR